MGAEFHCLPLQGQGACMEKGKLLQSKADKAGDESPGEDCGLPQTVGVNGRFPVWLCPRERQDRQNLCCPAAARVLVAANKRLYMAFVDLENSFDGLP